MAETGSVVIARRGYKWEEIFEIYETTPNRVVYQEILRFFFMLETEGAVGVYEEFNEWFDGDGAAEVREEKEESGLAWEQIKVFT